MKQTSLCYLPRSTYFKFRKSDTNYHVVVLHANVSRLMFVDLEGGLAYDMCDMPGALQVWVEDNVQVLKDEFTNVEVGYDTPSRQK